MPHLYHLLPLQQVNKLEITADKQLLAAAGNPHIRIYEVNSNNPQPVSSFERHTNNVTAIGFQKDGKWMYSGSEDGTVRIWDLRAPVSRFNPKFFAAASSCHRLTARDHRMGSFQRLLTSFCHDASYP